ncbi:MAG: rane protein, partial [Adhaeribacter sp.]|nr:rane protein [Adhaeribacter sp.]
MNKIKLRLLLFVFLTGMGIASCKVTQPYQMPAARMANLYRDIITNDTTTMANLRWQELFTDTTLQRLISQGIARNLNLQVAYTRIRQAQAYYQQSQAAFLPTLNGTIGATRSKLSEAQD